MQHSNCPSVIVLKPAKPPPPLISSRPTIRAIHQVASAPSCADVRGDAMNSVCIVINWHFLIAV